MKLLIATRNRPVSLGTVLGFLERFYPETQVIVADGSRPDLKAEVEASAKRFMRLAVDFRSYPFEMSYFDRVLDVLEGEREEFMVMGADDDYPMMDAYQRAETFLKGNPDYSLAIGSLLILELRSAGEISAYVRAVRPIAQEKPEARVQHFAAWPFPLSYSLVRREVLINRFRKCYRCDVGEVYDLQSGLEDCLKGKVHALPEVSVILTHNFMHSYLRVKSKLEYFERGPDIASLAREFAESLRESSGMNSEEALETAARMFSRHVGSWMTGIPYHRHPNFAKSPINRNALINQQFDSFERMFDPSTSEHRSYRDRLLYISEALRLNAGVGEADAVAAASAASEPSKGDTRSRAAASKPSSSVARWVTGARSRMSGRGNQGVPADASLIPRIEKKIRIVPSTLAPIPDGAGSA